MKQYRTMLTIFGTVATCLILLFAGWQVRGWYEGSKDAAQQEAEKKATALVKKLANDVADRTENAIQGIRIENRTIFQTAQKEIIREPVYRDCVVPADGVRRANQARGAAAGGEPHNPVPRDAGAP